MNKYQEALKKLRKIEQTENTWDENCDVLQELVDKATPKKPIQKAAGRNVCPNCMRSTAREVSPRYCSICGQRLDWSEE